MADGPAGVAVRGSIEAAVESVGDDSGPIATMYLFTVAKVLSVLPEEMQPGFDFYGVSWDVVFLTVLLGALGLLVYLWWNCLLPQKKTYLLSGGQMDAVINQHKKETELLQAKLEKYKQQILEKETELAQLEDGDEQKHVQTALEDQCEQSRKACECLESDIKSLRADLVTSQQELEEEQRQLLEQENKRKEMEEHLASLKSQFSESETAQKTAQSKLGGLQEEVLEAQEEMSRLERSREQLEQEAVGWSERCSEFAEQLHLAENVRKDLEESMLFKDSEIQALTECLLQLQLDYSSEDEESQQEEETGEDSARVEECSAEEQESDANKEQRKRRIQKMVDVARLNTSLKIMEEAKERFQQKLSDEMKAKQEIEERVQRMLTANAVNEVEVSELRNKLKEVKQRLEIMTEMYHEKELSLQRKLTLEEYQRQQKETKLSETEEQMQDATEDVQKYRRQVEQLAEELKKTEKSYKNQISTNEKKAHDNWLSARQAERELLEAKREAAHLRQQLTELEQKFITAQQMSLKPSLDRPDRFGPPGAPPPLGPSPVPLRPSPLMRRGPHIQDNSFGPSPVSGGRPSPPLMMVDGPLRPPSVSSSHGGYPKDAGLRGTPLPPSSYDHPGPGFPSDRGSPTSLPHPMLPPGPWDRRPGPPPLYGPPLPNAQFARVSGRFSAPMEMEIARGARYSPPMPNFRPMQQPVTVPLQGSPISSAESLPNSAPPSNGAPGAMTTTDTHLPIRGPFPGARGPPPLMARSSYMGPPPPFMGRPPPFMGPPPLPMGRRPLPMGFPPPPPLGPPMGHPYMNHPYSRFPPPQGQYLPPEVMGLRGPQPLYPSGRSVPTYLDSLGRAPGPTPPQVGELPPQIGPPRPGPSSLDQDSSCTQQPTRPTKTPPIAARPPDDNSAGV
uniref:transport and Golgi organization protein 1 homolog isoform X2 n=1 Tax=Myxine glutinosa TaxID=7769 RepID=UPI00358E6F5D